MKSVNNKLILEPYKSKGKIESKVSSGFATIAQKSTLVGLKLLADGKVMIGKDMVDVQRGQIAYFPEEVLHAHDWSKKTFHLEGSEENFIIADSVYVVAIK